MRYNLTALAILVASLALAIPAGASRTPPDARPTTLVFVMAGQSNMLGQGHPIPAATDDPRITTLLPNGARVPATNPIGDQGSGNNGTGGYGPAVTFAKSVADSTGDNVVIVMCAENGSGIARWIPGGDLYENCVTRVAEATQYGELAGFLFMQGETDAFSADAASLWATRFASMVDGFRASFGPVPVVFGQISLINTTLFPARDLERSAQASVTISCGAMVTTTDLPNDGIHFTDAGYDGLAHRFAAAWSRERFC